MRNPSGHQSENERVKKSENNRYDISSIKRVNGVESRNHTSYSSVAGVRFVTQSQ